MVETRKYSHSCFVSLLQATTNDGKRCHYNGCGEIRIEVLSPIVSPSYITTTSKRGLSTTAAGADDDNATTIASNDVSSPTSSTNAQHEYQHQHHCAELARMMIPTDANIAGNVHGGTIMQLMEESAGVAANRYFNQVPHNCGGTRVCALTSRVERMTFLHPVHVGDVAKVHAQVVFASMHTVAVSVTVTAERMAWSSSSVPQAAKQQRQQGRGEEQDDDDDKDDTSMICNHALLWLVGVVLPEQDSHHQVSVHEVNPKQYARALAPPFPIPNPETDPMAWKMYERASKAYESRKQQASILQLEQEEEDSDSDNTDSESDSDNTVSTTNETEEPAKTTQRPDPGAPDSSAVELVQVMLPSDCVVASGLVGGGVVMKLMDNACGVAAVRHCGTNIVTIAVDCVNLKAPVLLGDVLKVQAKPTFTSQKSMEIEVSVVAERFLPTATTTTTKAEDGSTTTRSEEEELVLTRQEVVTTRRAYFTFVSLPLQSSSEAGLSVSSLPMRPLVLQTSQDRAKFAAGKRRYEHRMSIMQKSQVK